jgi:hypothetical protein
MKHVLFLLPNKAGPDKHYRYHRGVILVWWSRIIIKKGSKLKLNAAAIVERVASARGNASARAQSTRLLCKLSHALSDDCCASLSQNPITIKTRSI